MRASEPAAEILSAAKDPMASTACEDLVTPGRLELEALCGREPAAEILSAAKDPMASTACEGW